MQNAVRNQQNFETPLVKGMLHDFVSYKAMLPEDAACLDKVVDDAGKKDVVLFDAAKATVTPVKHTIKLEAVK